MMDKEEFRRQAFEQLEKLQNPSQEDGQGGGNPPTETPPPDAPWFKRFGYEDDQKFTEDFNNFKTKATEYETKLAEYQREKAELESKLSAASPMQDETLQRLAVIKSSNEDDYKFHLRRMSGGIDPMEVQRLKYKERYGDISDIPVEFIDKQIYESFGIKNLDIDALDDDDREAYIEERKIKLKLIEKDSNNFLKSKEEDFNKVQIPGFSRPTDEQLAILRAQAGETWNGKIDPLLGATLKYSQKVVFDEEGKGELEYNFEPTPDDRAAYSKKLTEILHANAIAYSAEAVNEVATRLKQQMMIDKIDSIVADVAKKVSESRDAYWKNLINNPAGYVHNQQTTQTDEQRKYADIYEKNLQQLNNKRNGINY